jgi:hypothetical protein
MENRKMTIQLSMGGKIHTVSVEWYHHKGDQFTSVRACCSKGTCEDFNALFCCMIALFARGEFVPLKMNITNNFIQPGFTDVWLERQFRSQKAAREFVTATQQRVDYYLRCVAEDSAA